MASPLANPMLDHLLNAAKKFAATDLHLIVGVPPAFRVNGEIILADTDALSGEATLAIAKSLMNDEQWRKFEQEWELCISISHPQSGRCRATLYYRNGCPELSIRFSVTNIADRAALGLPEKIDELARKRTGLVLVTGPTGSGKTTTLNYMVNLINRERRCKIIMIEDPIEFTHQNDRAIIVQQEVLTDTHSFNRALVHGLRQDPDVIVVGEMRDIATMETALRAADTGHLVLTTVHAANATQTMERILGVFEGNMQRQVQIQLANSLQGMISQLLLPSADRSRRVLAYELLIANSAIRHIIRGNNTAQLESVMQTSSKEGMVVMDNCLADLYKRAVISYDTALNHSLHPENLSKEP
jgi:twitching motility protein PilT